MRWLPAALALLLGVLVPAAGRAQEDNGGMSFELNSILVASFLAEQPFLDPEAQRVRGLVEEALSERYLVVRMDEVPAFTDYEAEVYLRSCPDGQYIGCVFVVGGRAQTDWTIGGRVRAVEGGYQVFLSFIDVEIAKLVLEFDVVLDGSNDEEFKAGVLEVVDALVADEVGTLDIRAEGEQARAEDEARDARDRDAQRFSADSVYEDPEAIERGDTGADAVGDGGGHGKVGRDELDEMEARGGLTPWERAGLTKGQYRLYRNSGHKLIDFKKRLQGRRGELLFRLSMQVGSGPWAQQHETWYVQDGAADPTSLRRADILGELSVQTQQRALSLGGQLELGIGITPWMELGVFGGLRQAPYGVRYQRQLDGVETDLSALEAVAAMSWQLGGRIGIIPFPAYPVRPTFHAGASFWAGSSLTAASEPPSYLAVPQVLRPNNLLMAHVQPGAEVSLGRWVVLWTRFDLDIPIVGRNFQSVSRGSLSGLVGRPSTATDTGFALGGSAGLLVRIRVAGDR